MRDNLIPTFLARQVAQAAGMLLVKGSENKDAIPHTIDWSSTLLSSRFQRYGCIRRIHVVFSVCRCPSGYRIEIEEAVGGGP
jgi:hypothetical protein